MSRPDDQGKERMRYALNLTLAGVAGGVGCLTLVVVSIALFAGWWLDNYLGTKPLFIILLLIGSVPVTLFLMFRWVRMFTSHIKSVEKKPTVVPPEEDTDRE